MGQCVRLFFALFIAILIVFSCSKSGSDPSENNNPPSSNDQYCQADTITIRDTFTGTHSFTLSGNVSLSYNNLMGIGFQVIIPTVFNAQSECIRSFQIGLYGNNPDSSALALYLGEERPAAGSYQVGNVDYSPQFLPGIAAVFALTEGSQSGLYLGSDGGTINITASSDQNLSGNFSIQASGYRIVAGNPNQQPVNNVTISGTFQLTLVPGGMIPSGVKAREDKQDFVKMMKGNLYESK